mmetsp:Transcript_39222/g.76714  ORF Transcript_39222/g.76714 Transcript_39222/m.76714 type:complete len:216 (+) Transcript_39222:124-771(+)
MRQRRHLHGKARGMHVSRCSRSNRLWWGVRGSRGWTPSGGSAPRCWTASGPRRGSWWTTTRGPFSAQTPTCTTTLRTRPPPRSRCGSTTWTAMCPWGMASTRTCRGRRRRRPRGSGMTWLQRSSRLRLAAPCMRTRRTGVPCWRTRSPSPSRWRGRRMRQTAAGPPTAARRATRRTTRCATMVSTATRCFPTLIPATTTAKAACAGSSASTVTRA